VQSSSYGHALDTLPKGLGLHSVTAVPSHVFGRDALRIVLTKDTTLHGKPDINYVDMPTFAAIPVAFCNGTISVDVLSRLNTNAPDYARAFAGIAYRIADDLGSFECAYLRPLNGCSLNPPAPRDKRAVQYFAFPDWRYERLRGAYPDGRFEAGALILPGTWINLRVEVQKQKLDVYVDGKLVLAVAEAKADPVFGKVGLFVDIGTEAYFSNLDIIANTN
jgi:hypothetical protein